MAPSDCVKVQWVGEPIPTPGRADVRPFGGRFTHYGALEIVEPAAAATTAVSVGLNDIVEVACKRGAGVTNDGIESDQPFLAQAEGFWEDAFTGICYFRARWLLRASEVPEEVAEDEVVLTTVSDSVDAASILGLAPMGLPTANLKPEPLPPVEVGAPVSDRVLRARRSSARKGKGRKRAKNATLLLWRSFDPFAGVFGDLPVDHPALVQLRRREGAKIAQCDGARDSEKGAKGGHQRRGPGRPRKVITPRFSARGSPRKSSASDRVGAERKGLQGARLAVRSSRAPPRERSESLSSSSSSGSSISVGGNSESSVGSISSCGSNSGFTSGDSEDEDFELDVCTNASPTARRGRKKEAVSAARAKSVAKPVEKPEAKPEAKPAAQLAEHPVAPVPAVQVRERPRRLAMPPCENPDPASGTESSSDVGQPTDAALASPVTAKKPLLRGGPLVREAHQGGDLVDGEPSPMTEYRHRETDVGEEHQADIPPLLTEAQRLVERDGVDAQNTGGTLVWRSDRYWNARDKGRLEDYLEKARRATHQRRLLPGVPAVVCIGNGGDRRRKRKTAWAVMAGGKPEDPEKICVVCSGREVLEVSSGSVQPVQIEEQALEAFMEHGSLSDTRGALSILQSRVDESGPLATWTANQIKAVSEAHDRNFDFDRYSRSRGHDRYRDEHTDLASLSTSVPGKTPSQVLSFYYRYMASGDALTDIMGGVETQVKKRSERKITRPRTPPPPRPSPPPNLRHRSSLRCPPRLAKLQDSDSSNGGSSRLPGRRAPGGERADLVKAGSKAVVVNANGVRGGGGGRVIERRAVEPRRAMSGDAFGRRADLGQGGGDGFDRRRGGERDAAFSDGADGERSVPWAQEGEPSGAREAKGFKRSLDERGLGDTKRGLDREPQRPRRLEAPRAAIPVDAVIVEVSDDDETPGFNRGSLQDGDRGYSTQPSGRDLREPSSQPLVQHQPRVGRSHPYPEGSAYDPRYDYRRQDHRMTDNRRTDGRNNGQAYRYHGRGYQNDHRHSNGPHDAIGRSTRPTGRGVGDNGLGVGGGTSMQDPRQRSMAGYDGQWGGDGSHTANEQDAVDSGGFSPIERCWLLVDHARKTNLPHDRVEYLRGLLEKHETTKMTFVMLVDRTGSCLYDRADLQREFVRLFSLMNLPQPRRPFRAAPRHADCTNGSVYGIGARSAPRRAPEYPLEVSSGTARDEGMERVVAAVTVSKAIVGARERERSVAEPEAMAFASDMRMLGVGTSMRGSGACAAPIPEGYPEQGGNASNAVRTGARSARTDSDQATQPPPTGTLARTPLPLRLTDGAADASKAATESSTVSSANNPLPGQTPSWIGGDRTGGSLATVPARGQFPIASSSTGWDPRQADNGYHDNRSADAGEDMPVAQAGRSSPAFARTAPPAAAFESAEQWDGIDIGGGEYGRGVSGRP